MAKNIIQTQLDRASSEILAEYLRHGQAVRKERERAKATTSATQFH